MADEEAAPQGEGTFEIKVGGDKDRPLSILEATRAVKKAREEALQPEAPKTNGAAPVEEPPSEPAPEPEPDNAPSVEEPPEAPVEPTQAEPEAEQLPPIEPPRSWPKEDKERFAGLPRETQEYLSERERQSERTINQRLQEAAEQRKSYETQRQQAEQIRAQYEAALPQIMQAVQAQAMGEFADVKTWADVEKLAQEDPFRYQRFQLAQQKAQALQQEMTTAQERQQKEIGAKWKEFSEKEDGLFAEQAPEMADPARAQALRSQVSQMLDETGFSKEELDNAWFGKTGVSLRDHRTQLILRKAALWDEANAKAKAVTKAPVPPVQRPGTTRPRGADNLADIQRLEKQLETASGRRSIEIATQITQLKRELGR